ncbi:DUF1868 domain-containing protein [Gluconacetobacter sp. 1b LMG 1731]|uniref:DUF1868 domain-containing protein n=1 Tax=Gluconacetobacter dulcium TaxID=2729096 RepID=A0A7W4INH0_9PROT|nr:DUF1868 domain-containing protein [Gluconacetobacter dulcium]MBB2165812.1 DUF1868 domain-containing protein [Gluconacetobacter dulcium]MBB2194922.1 DUF1868 domain-containing protein [Gluconacetobacter dulcium]
MALTAPTTRRRVLSAIAGSLLPACTGRAAQIPEVGRKFDASGAALPFHGNTIIIPLDRGSAAATLMATLHDALADSPIARQIALLPLSSFHMTVFEGVNDHDRTPRNWPAALPIDAPIATATQYATRALTAAPFDYPQPIVMRARGLSITDRGVRLNVTGFDDTQEGAIRHLRDEIAARLAIHRPSHARYGFHMSLAYTIAPLDPDARARTQARIDALLAETPAERRALSLGAPRFCTYDDMLAFTPLFPLPRQS